MELWTSFISLRQLSTESLSCEDGELDNISPILILVKTECLGCLSLFSLWKTEGFRILSFPILLNMERSTRRWH